MTSNIYQMRFANPQQWGPYAILVREAAFKPKEMGTWDYLAMPEIIDDICKEYQSKYGDSIYQDVFVRLKPSIVKFESEYPRDNNIIKSAISYIYAKAHGKRLCLDANTCFDAKGNAIPHSDILKIDCISC